MNGWGTMEYPDGTRYEGTWKDGDSHGFGIFTQPSPDNTVRAGFWNEG